MRLPRKNVPPGQRCAEHDVSGCRSFHPVSYQSCCLHYTVNTRRGNKKAEKILDRLLACGHEVGMSTPRYTHSLSQFKAKSSSGLTSFGFEISSM